MIHRTPRPALAAPILAAALLLAAPALLQSVEAAMQDSSLSAAHAALSAQTLADFEPPTPSDLRRTVERFTQDRSLLLRRYSIESPQRRARMEEFYREWEARLDGLDYEALNLEGKIDWVLLMNRIRYELDRLGVNAELEAELEPILPFQGELVRLHRERRELLGADPRGSAEALHQVSRAIERARKRVEEARSAGEAVDGTELTPVVAVRAVSRLNELRQATTAWFGHFDGYDPLFSWWVRAPFEEFTEAVEGYVGYLRSEVAGIRPGEEEPTIGDPLGREALLLDLRNEMIAYSPEELMELAERELAWGEARLREAAAELGFDDDWHAALEHVKGLHVPPGEQIHLVTELAREAEEFVEAHELVTVPPLAREVWRMEMLSPARQRIAPFFLGGEVVQVAFPTDEMTHEEKVMSLRANNEHFSRAVVHHELIPGHHLQGFMTSRYSTHRSLFSTPFWGEGWALYWELLLWDLNFARGPEDRIGMLVWRNHRAARILFSLSFHLELMTPEEAVELLVERVGFERAASEAEVRRSFTGQYSPLYQAGYLLGGLQLRQLHRELVESGTMTNRAFHDHILKSGRIPIEMVRASLTGEPPPRDFEPTWRFYSLEP